MAFTLPDWFLSFSPKANSLPCKDTLAAPSSSALLILAEEQAGASTHSVLPVRSCGAWHCEVMAKDPHRRSLRALLTGIPADVRKNHEERKLPQVLTVMQACSAVLHTLWKYCWYSLKQREHSHRQVAFVSCRCTKVLAQVFLSLEAQEKPGAPVYWWEMPIEMGLNKQHVYSLTQHHMVLGSRNHQLR